MGKLILSIDDSNVIRMSLELLCKENGYSHEHAFDGLEGLKKDEEIKKSGKDISLIICDINMAKMDGMSFLREFKSKDENKLVPVLMLTTESQISMMQEAKKSGATGWIVKPFQSDQLISFIKRFAR
jgi:two-component system chemotaxis response regulator CheY